ncbi:hypothetical protein B7486_54935 [cyanobacterium TDX16]|nr:hypothetical protein B7486_54935 [cyanobacterium TDX16]
MAATDSADVEQDLTRLERQGWEALATEGAAAGFYDGVLADDVLMLLPGGMVIDDRQTVVDSMGGAPWSSYELRDVRVLPVADGVAVVAYEATAVRDEQPYTALFNSTYRHEDGRWKLVLHQQTPVG